MLAYRVPKLRSLVLRMADLFQTIPALALLGILMVFFGAGKATVIVGVTLYSLLPIVRNTCLGLDHVDPGVRDAARGMGMSAGGRLLFVELPLAFPTIFTGVRIAVVNAIGTAVFAAFVGGGGLGGILNRSIRTQNLRLLLVGTAALMVIAVVLDSMMGALEKALSAGARAKRKAALPAALLAVLFALSLPFGFSAASGQRELVLYDGDYSETQLVHRMVKFLVEEKTDLTVSIRDQMSQVNNFKALTSKNPSCDLMLSYDGTLLTTFLHLDPADVPQGETIASFADKTAQAEYGVQLLGALGFDNTYAIAVPETLAERYGLHTVSDLVPVAGELRFGAEHEFFTLEGSMKYEPFVTFYGLAFQSAVPVDVSLKYAAIESGSFDVTEVYATDGLNRKANLRVLEDDRSFFPDYNGALLVREDLFERFSDAAPQLCEVLLLLEGKISNDDMVEMTYRVDVLGESVDDVAREFLQTRGLLGGE